MNKLKVLFVSIAFPPKFDSESLQIERIFKEMLSREALEIGVITASSKYVRNMPTSDEMESFSHKVKFYVEVDVFENRWVNKFLGVVGLLNMPDPKRMFATKTISVLRKLPHSFDAIYSRSFPPSSSLLAEKMANKLNLPWVMHLSDPWYLSPTNKYSWIEKRYNKLVERRCLERADFVSFTSERTLELYKSYYPALSRKFFLSFNSVTSLNDTKRTSNRTVNHKLKLVHAGLLNNDRNPQILIKSLRSIKERRPDIFGMLDVVFVGAIDRRIRNLLESNKDLLSYDGVVGYPTANEIINSADLVFAFDNAFVANCDAVFLPSKLLDYAKSGKKIVCITNKGSPSDQFVKEIGGIVFDHSSWLSLADFICDAVDRKAKRENDFFAARPLPIRYTTPKVVDAIVEKLERSIRR